MIQPTKAFQEATKKHLEQSIEAIDRWLATKPVALLQVKLAERERLTKELSQLKIEAQ